MSAWDKLLEATPFNPTGPTSSQTTTDGSTEHMPPELEHYFEKNPTRGDVNIVSLSKKSPSGNPIVYAVNRPNQKGQSFVLPQERILRAIGKGKSEDLNTWIKTIGEYHVENNEKQESLERNPWEWLAEEMEKK